MTMEQQQPTELVPLEWRTEQRKPTELVGCEFNPRKLGEAGRQRLLASLRKFNLVDIPVVNADNTILSGHQRVALLIAEGRADEPIDVRLPNRLLTTQEAKEYMLQANTHAGEFDVQILLEEFADIDVQEIVVDVPELDVALAPPKEPRDPKDTADYTPDYRLVIECANEMQQQERYEQITNLGIPCKPLTL